ncbi:peptidyl-prolyl cis-trans isomerase FKBP17-1, chloroplastic [Vigna unguiculata]|uniref:peptidyl-prolyl cis-trans isomerase FKBP17-1, chloroplastic n=1 Tax=Vigna unguiculata TaxID=3917 RepID=UPI001015D2E4|nr:peptidyl-prolyl cis-trans isomerase FKBP17-1, chloroplastic [Vigna unguiculata]
MKTIIECCVSASATRVCGLLPYRNYNSCNSMLANCSASSSTTRRTLSLSLISTTFSAFIFSLSPPSSSSSTTSSSSSSSSSKLPLSKFFEIPDSGGVQALDLLDGSGEVPSDGDQVAIHYYGRLAAKQGWRFDSTYDHKDDNGEPNPFVFVLGSGKVIAGIDVAVRSMKVGGIRRVIIPPSLGYQNTSQEPIPPNFFDRQRLFTTIFNPTRRANGEGSTLGTVIFDIELVSVRHQ